QKDTGKAWRSHGKVPFVSLPGGLSEMIRALVAALPAASIRLNSPVARILAHPSTVSRCDRSDSTPFQLQIASGETLTARSLVLAAPAYVAGRLLREVDDD